MTILFKWLLSLLGKLITRKPAPVPTPAVHPILAFMQEPKAWRPEPAFSDTEIEQLHTFFRSSACTKLDIAIHNIALQDMQRAWSAPASQREFEIGAAQGRLAAWATIKNLPESLTPKREHPEDADTVAATLEHLRP